MTIWFLNLKHVGMRKSRVVLCFFSVKFIWIFIFPEGLYLIAGALFEEKWIDVVAI